MLRISWGCIYEQGDAAPMLDVAMYDLGTMSVSLTLVGTH